MGPADVAAAIVDAARANEIIADDRTAYASFDACGRWYVTGMTPMGRLRVPASWSIGASIGDGLVVRFDVAGGVPIDNV